MRNKQQNGNVEESIQETEMPTKKVYAVLSIEQLESFIEKAKKYSSRENIDSKIATTVVRFTDMTGFSKHTEGQLWLSEENN